MVVMKKNLSIGSLKLLGAGGVSFSTEQNNQDSYEREQLTPFRSIELETIEESTNSHKTISHIQSDDTQNNNEKKSIERLTTILLDNGEVVEDDNLNPPSNNVTHSNTETLEDIDEIPTCTMPSKGAIFRIVMLVLLISGIGVFLGFLIGSRSVQTSLIEALEWLSRLPKWAGSLLVMGMYALSLPFFCPGTPFNLAAGFLFGMWLGAGVAMGGCVLGATISFFLGRTIAREWVKEKMNRRPSFKAVDWAIQKNGVYIVFLTRLSPLFPFPLLNYAFGITKVEVWKYLLGTTAGVLPATFGYTYLGTLMRSLTDIWTAGSGDKNPSLVWLIVGSILTIVSIIVISIITKRAVAKATEEYERLQTSQSNDTEIPDLESGEKETSDISLSVEETPVVTLDDLKTMPLR